MIAFRITAGPVQKEKKITTLEDYEEMLASYGVPKDYYKIVVAQSRMHAIYNCPAAIWKEEEMVKMLIIKRNPVLVEYEAEDFLFVASQAYVNFHQFDGTEFPDWAEQPKIIKEMFLPYVELTEECGGLDYKKQIYWAGTICVYSKSLHEIFEMMGHPLKDYHLNIDNKKCMLSDGSIPEDLLKEKRDYDAKVKAEKEAAEQQKSAETEEMSSRLESLERTLEQLVQNQNSAQITADQINQLTVKLLEEGRMEELKKATADPEYQKKLVKEYGL